MPVNAFANKVTLIYTLRNSSNKQDTIQLVFTQRDCRYSER